MESRFRARAVEGAPPTLHCACGEISSELHSDLLGNQCFDATADIVADHPNAFAETE